MIKMLDKFSGEQKKQFILTSTIIGGVAAAVVVLMTAFQGDKPKKTIDAPSVNIVDKEVTDASVFRKEYGDKEASNSAQIEALKKQLEAMKENNTSAQSPQQGLLQQNQNKSLPTFNQSGTNAGNFLTPPPPPPVADNRNPNYEIKDTPKNVKPTVTVMNNMIGVVSGTQQTASAQKASGDDAQISEKETKKKKSIELPSGTFMQGILLSGLDAPTGGKAKSSPQPVLIKITNIANLPNKFKADLKECDVVGFGYGDLSSERAYIRVEKLTCMTNSGKAIEKGTTGSSIGYVTGEDGKVGLGGKVVSKQGAMLARTLAAGFLDGVSKSFTASSMTYSIQPTGSIGTPNPSDTLQNGLFGGAGEASKKLADFYMKLANEMFPVVEVQAGRKVDIILLEKLSFSTDEIDKKGASK
jgi:conjugal transfer pilus assembly protein TraB